MKVSVIMPVYNAEKYITTAVESILNQTFQDFELILIDDCSTDASVQIIKAIQSSKIQLLHTPQNSGAAASRNLGIAAANGEYIAFLDADDWAYPQRLQKQVDFLDKNPAIGVVGTWTEIIDENGKLIDEFVWEIEQSHIAPRLFFHNCFATSSVMLTKALALLQFDEEYPPAEDYELWMRLSTQTQFGIIREKLVKYLSHSQGISKLKQKKMKENTLRILLNGLDKFGIKPTEKEIALHAQIAHLEFEISKVFLADANQWLLKLKNANEKKKIFLLKDMNSLLAYYWFRIAAAHHSLGAFTLLLLLNSSLRKYLPLTLQVRLFARCMLSTINSIF
ncbi:MAG: glycosyltransferase family 2 protein [Cytophagales bacterium]|nr:MAG: glycosyltransferase family 2 protein [Cytophagales bacterium]